MKILAPLSASDSDRCLEEWTPAIRHFGNLEGHTISFLPTLDSTDVAQEAASLLSADGIQCEILTMDQNPYGGWPRASNTQFYEGARLMARQQSPWLWMEMDVLPVRANWAHLIASAYSSSGKPFLGHVIKTPWRNMDTGESVKSDFGDDDTMMCGVGVYPAKMFNLEQFQLFADFVKGEEASPKDGFDIWLRFAINQYGVNDSKLFDDKWNTINHRMENGVLTCDHNPTHPGLDPAWPVLRRGGPISSDAAIVHGCKDGSLFRLIMGGLDFSNVKRPVSVQHTAGEVDPGYCEVQSTESRKPTDDRIDRLEAKFDALIAALQPKAPAAIPAKAKEDWPFTPPAKTKSKSSDIIDQLTDIIAKHPKIRLSDAAEKLDIPVNKLKNAISKNPEAGIVIAAFGRLSISAPTT